MALTDAQKEFCSKTNFNPETFEALTAETLPEGFVVEDAAKAYNDIKLSLNKKALEAEFDKNSKTNYGKTLIKVMRDLNTTLDLGFTSDEIKEIDYKDFLNEKLKGTIDAKIAESSTNGDDELKQRYDSVVDKLQKQSEAHNAKITEITSTYESKLTESGTEISKYIQDNEYEMAWNRAKVGVSEEHRPVYKKFFKDKIFENYRTAKGGALTDLKGERAMNFSEDGVFETIDQPLEALIKAHNVSPQSNTKKEPPIGTTTVAGGGEMHPDDKRYLESLSQ